MLYYGVNGYGDVLEMTSQISLKWLNDDNATFTVYSINKAVVDPFKQPLTSNI